MAEGEIVIFCDFDGTVTKNDISVAILSKYARWGERTRTIVKGNIGSKAAYSEVANFVNASIDELRRFAKEVAQIEDGFLEFVDLVRSRKYRFFIVSDGFGFYIKEILAKYGLEFDFFASELVSSGGDFKFDFPNSGSFCDLCATCKLKIIREKGGKNFKVFIGNGISDRCAVEEADIVFAKSRLQDICYMKGISFFHFDDFKDIIYASNLSPKCFVIDFDGTLGWSYEGILDAFSYTFKRMKKEPPPREELSKLIGFPLDECFRITLGEGYEKATKIFRRRYEKVFLRKTYLAPCAKKTLEELKKMGYKLVILSNKYSRFLKTLVKHFDLDVDLVIGEGDVVEEGRVLLKPDPRVLDFVSRELGVDKEQMFVVGDTHIDLATAKDSNFVALYSSHLPPSYFRERGKVVFFLACISDLIKLGRFYKILNS